ncbi:unnamed protein product [Pelagomonas calceolata]|uniref:START domain-containing protein n=1 Tax=Pelagomonas calceolata TaxID=35677 RepID=A0A8J2SGD9_9STRA|nr:unnamed protein product [Pelagomonas calceolata]
MFCLSPCKDTHAERRPPPTPPRRQPTPVAAPVARAAVEPPSSTRWYANAVAALVVAVACALLSPARAAGVAAAAVAIVLALRGPRKRRRPSRLLTPQEALFAAPLAPPDDALAAASYLVHADATVDPAARGWRLAEEERGVGRYLRDAAGGGRDAMSVGTVNASAAVVDAALGRAAAQAPSVVEPLRDSIRPLSCTEPPPALAEGWTQRGNVATAHIICKRVWPVSQRDMVLTTAAATRDDGAFLRFATSTAHADAPLDADRVRLEVRGSGYLIEPRGDASCRVTHVSCVAPGDAPAFLVNRLAWQRTAMVLKVRALVLADSS